MRIAGLNVAELFGQAIKSPRAESARATAYVSPNVRGDEPGPTAAKRVIDAEILTRSVTSPSTVDRSTPINPRSESLPQPPLLDKSSDQRVIKYLETFLSTDHESLSSPSLDTYA